jgi:hypothetical protein
MAYAIRLDDAAELDCRQRACAQAKHDARDGAGARAAAFSERLIRCMPMALIFTPFSIIFFDD